MGWLGGLVGWVGWLGGWVGWLVGWLVGWGWIPVDGLVATCFEQNQRLVPFKGKPAGCPKWEDLAPFMMALLSFLLKHDPTSWFPSWGFVAKAPLNFRPRRLWLLSYSTSIALEPSWDEWAQSMRVQTVQLNLDGHCCLHQRPPQSAILIDAWFHDRLT